MIFRNKESSWGEVNSRLSTCMSEVEEYVRIMKDFDILFLGFSSIFWWACIIF